MASAAIFGTGQFPNIALIRNRNPNFFLLAILLGHLAFETDAVFPIGSVEIAIRFRRLEPDGYGLARQRILLQAHLRQEEAVNHVHRFQMDETLLTFHAMDFIRKAHVVGSRRKLEPHIFEQQLAVLIPFFHMLRAWVAYAPLPL